MHARVTFTQGTADMVDEAIRQVRAIQPMYQKQKGFKGMYTFANRETGKGFTVSLWETEADLLASEEMGNRARQDVTKASHITATAVERYEVVLHP